MAAPLAWQGPAVARAQRVSASLPRPLGRGPHIKRARAALAADLRSDWSHYFSVHLCDHGDDGLFRPSDFFFFIPSQRINLDSEQAIAHLQNWPRGTCRSVQKTRLVEHVLPPSVLCVHLVFFSKITLFPVSYVLKMSETKVVAPLGENLCFYSCWLKYKERSVRNYYKHCTCPAFYLHFTPGAIQ